MYRQLQGAEKSHVSVNPDCFKIQPRQTGDFNEEGKKKSRTSKANQFFFKYLMNAWKKKESST